MFEYGYSRGEPNATTRADITPRYVAVYGNGSWGGSGKIHAANAESYDPGIKRYRSLCGQRYMVAATDADGEYVPFSSWLHLEQCQRCAKAVAKDG